MTLHKFSSQEANQLYVEHILVYVIYDLVILTKLLLIRFRKVVDLNFILN